MDGEHLFDLGEERPPDRPDDSHVGGGRVRLRCANRQQIAFRSAALDDLLPDDHKARVVWAYVDGLDFTPLYEQIRAVEGKAGRRATDPKIFMALWLYATLEGVGSARQLDRLCEEHLAYQWIAGDVSMNYHSLADFRVDHGEFLDQLLTESVATLIHEGLVDLKRVAQDGMRVRASAGAASFRREPTLDQCLADAEAQVQKLREELESDPAATSKRQKAAQERAARERKERVQKALDELKKIRDKKKPQDKDKARASTTDPEARVMKMPDGGFRPAYNVQFSSDTAGQIIAGVDVINTGSDQGQMSPMNEQIEERYGIQPEETLVDGGFATKNDIEKVSPPQGKTTVYAPVMKSKDPNRDDHTPLADDVPAVAEWRQRMGTDEAKEIYKERASTAECVNAIARNRGFWQFPVRGSPKVRVIALWYALAHNLMRGVALRAEAAAAVS